MQDADCYATKKIVINQDDCTEFQIYTTSNKRVIDFTLFKLKAYLSTLSDYRQKTTLQFVLKQYLNGKIAVAWKSGEPLWRQIIDGK